MHGTRGTKILCWIRGGFDGCTLFLAIGTIGIGGVFVFEEVFDAVVVLLPVSALPGGTDAMVLVLWLSKFLCAFLAVFRENKPAKTGHKMKK